MAERILVVDDLADLRTLLRRALTRAGYEVGVAATLDEASAMDPAGYDAVIADANLGAERGTDLIAALGAQDETALARCLVMTGGAVDALPDGVAYLTKPFQVDDLLAAVRALLEPGTAAAPRQHERAPAAPAGRRPAAHAAAGPEHGAAPQLGPLLGVVRRLRARERRDLADYLHDGPIQELTAASLELQLMRRTEPASPHAGPLRQQVEAASGALRYLVDLPWPPGPGEAGLTELIRQRTAWLLAAPATVEIEAGLGPDQALLIADIAELTLLATEEAAPGARAHIAARADQQVIQIDTILTPALDDQTIGDPVLAEAALNGAAAALGAIVSSEISDQQWHIRLAVRRAIQLADIARSALYRPLSQLGRRRFPRFPEEVLQAPLRSAARRRYLVNHESAGASGRIRQSASAHYAHVR
jgi:ActR/RegA family two-component response regulator